MIDGGRRITGVLRVLPTYTNATSAIEPHQHKHTRTEL